MRMSPGAVELPRFRSLVVHGPYVPSAPIHLCLSAPDAILCTPSRDALLNALSADHWLSAHASTGSVAAVSSRVTVFYPASPQALLTLLVSLRKHDVSDPSIPIAPKVTLDRVPPLLVLHELSSYFLTEPGVHTVSSYLLLITHALSTAEFLSSQSPSSPPASLAVFDTRLDHLKLPVLRTPSRSAIDGANSSEEEPRPESVLFFVEKYFELSGTFQSDVFTFHRIGENGLFPLLTLSRHITEVAPGTVPIADARVDFSGRWSTEN